MHHGFLENPEKFKSIQTLMPHVTRRTRRTAGVHGKVEGIRRSGDPQGLEGVARGPQSPKPPRQDTNHLEGRLVVRQWQTALRSPQGSSALG